MNLYLDLVLVLASVTAAGVYLWRRYMPSLKKQPRDWSTGHSEHACNSCPVIEVRKRQQARG